MAEAVHETDEDLVRRAAEGDRAAFERPVGRHADSLYRFAPRTCGGEREAEDALRWAPRALARRGTFRGESAARTWLFQVVIHACRRRHRRRAGEPERMEEMEAALSVRHDGAAPDGQVAAREVGAAIDAALARMSSEAREILMLRDVEGLEGAEVAAALGISLAAREGARKP